MSAKPPSDPNASRGRGAGSSRGRGSRSRGKAARARGSSRGMRVPPEYLARVIAQREGRDPSEISNEEEEEEEAAAAVEYMKRFAPRAVVQNQEEPEDVSIQIIGGEEEAAVEEERQAELETQRILALHRQKAPASGEKPFDPNETGKTAKSVDVEGDVDHELGESLRAMKVRDRTEDTGEKATKSKVVQVEWDEELESLQRGKEEAEARTALKQRFKNPGARGRTTGAASLARKPATSQSTKPEMDQLEGYLDELLR